MCKKTVMFVLLLLIALNYSGCLNMQARYTELGCPTADFYEEDPTARCVWDIIAWDGKLYVGSGDYDANAGPVPAAIIAALFMGLVFFSVFFAVDLLLWVLVVRKWGKD